MCYLSTAVRIFGFSAYLSVIWSWAKFNPELSFGLMFFCFFFLFFPTGS